MRYLWARYNRKGVILNIEYKSFCPVVKIGLPTTPSASEYVSPQLGPAGGATLAGGRGG
jgi:hypothetical protein